jgi:hypothetical protein
MRPDRGGATFSVGGRYLPERSFSFRPSRITLRLSKIDAQRGKIYFDVRYGHRIYDRLHNFFINRF